MSLINDSTSKTKLDVVGGPIAFNGNNTSIMQGIGQQPHSPKVVRILRTKELQSKPLGDSPKHTHYHSEYDLAKPPKHLKNKKYHRRFHYRLEFDVYLIFQMFLFKKML